MNSWETSVRVQSPKCVAINLEGRTSATYSRHSRWARGLFEPMGSTKRPVTLWMFVIYIDREAGISCIHFGVKKEVTTSLKGSFSQGLCPTSFQNCINSAWWIIVVYQYILCIYTHTHAHIYIYIIDISILWKFYYLVSSNHCHHLSFGMQSKASYDWWFLN